MALTRDQVRDHFIRVAKKRYAWRNALRDRIRKGRSEVISNSEPWMLETPKTVADAIALSDRIAASIERFDIARG